MRSLRLYVGRSGNDRSSLYCSEDEKVNQKTIILIVIGLAVAWFVMKRMG